MDLSCLRSSIIIAEIEVSKQLSSNNKMPLTHVQVGNTKGDSGSKEICIRYILKTAN